LWARRDDRVPTGVDGGTAMQAYDRPIVNGEQVFIAQPGVRTVECVELATGRPVWRRVWPNVVGMVGLAGGRLVVQTTSGVVGVDAGTGKTVWQRELLRGDAVVGCAADRVLLTRRGWDPKREREEQSLRRVTLTWLDAASGKETGRARLEGAEWRHAQVGPIFSHTDAKRAWVFVGKESQASKRDLCEWISTGAALRGEKSVGTDPWRVESRGQ
jgi:outer membrane protein assembly factor BamB